MNRPAPSPGLDAAIEAAADCVRLYQAAIESVDDRQWKAFLERMLLHRQTLLHRLRFIGGSTVVEQQDADDLAGWRSWLGGINLSLKGLINDPIKTALATIEPADARLVETLGAIGVVTADPDEMIEIVNGVTAEHEMLRSLFSELTERHGEAVDQVPAIKDPSQQ